jgi:hypothetical protein
MGKVFVCISLLIMLTLPTTINGCEKLAFYMGAASLHNYPDMNWRHNLVGIKCGDISFVGFDNSFGDYTRGVVYTKFWGNFGFGGGLAQGYGSGEEILPYVAPMLKIRIWKYEILLTGLPQLDASGNGAIAVILKTVDFDLK